MSHAVRISKKSDLLIEELVEMTKKSKIMIIEEALEILRFRERMRLFNESYERLQSDEKAWGEELQERLDLEGTLEDGLENE